MEQAWHEAGHAVMARLLGGCVRWVTLESDLDEHSGHTEVAWTIDGVELDCAELAVALAGPLAELDYREMELAHADELFAAWRADGERIAECLERIEPREERRAAALIATREQVGEKLAQQVVRERVARVAEALDAHESLDRMLFEECFG